ncbi:NAD(P)H-dependent oxidoreductase [Mesorhizobium sp. WSM4906]|uniref:NADPH-dependent FMN reductase n=1 Tax=Mesorhizobium sp. WSM4906 TaxID=3038546 RepID=UPI00241774AB|nr:NAD(P)H-dependent oxidoreductase [Mesorhizobium sp. WSM4906]WFP73701.1 NAD(P)H-dependent oxidoreductase [Mesorhizobium sp. WSM4906]
MIQRPRIAIVISTTRPGRFGDTPAEWLLGLAQARDDADFELIDLRDYPMPFFNEERALVYAPAQNPVAVLFAEKMRNFDGFIFITAEYNHSITGVLKNALDYLYTEMHRKPATFVGYGGVGGSRAVEHLRHILAELQMATLKYAVHIGATELIGMLREGRTMADFPHLADAAFIMIDDLLWWTNALKMARAAKEDVECRL